MKDCPYCAESIKSDALKCRYCGSMFESEKAAPGSSAGGNYWRRINEGKRVAGVCAGLAREFNAPRIILPLRIFFILTTLFYGFGLITYVVLWLLMPSPVDNMPVETNRDNRNYDKSETGTRETRYTKKTSAASLLFGLMIIITGLVFLASTVLHGGYRFLPFNVQVNTPGFMNFQRHFFDIGLISSVFPLMIILGLILVFFGVLKALRISIGCLFIILGSVMMLMFPSLMPRLLILPGLFIFGIIFIIIGIIKLLFGSTKTIEEVQQTDSKPVDDSWE